MSAEEQFARLQQLAKQQQQQIIKANDFANQQTLQLQESQRQLQQAQQMVQSLTESFKALSTQPQPLTVNTAPKRKPELPPFDSRLTSLSIAK